MRKRAADDEEVLISERSSYLTEVLKRNASASGSALGMHTGRREPRREPTDMLAGSRSRGDSPHRSSMRLHLDSRAGPSGFPRLFSQSCKLTLFSPFQKNSFVKFFRGIIDGRPPSAVP